MRTVPPSLAALLLAVVAALLLLALAAVAPDTALALLPAAVALMVALLFYEAPLLAVGLAALVARVALARREADPPRDLAWRLGEASFGIYLSWVFVEAALVVALRLADPGAVARLALLPAGLAASLALGWLAWRLIELPAAQALASLR